MSTKLPTVGAAFTATFTDILPLPILLYWSLKVILDEIVSPDAVLDPVKFKLSVKPPLLSTPIAALDDVNDATAAVP